MKAAVVCANEDVQYLDYEEPIPGPGEVKVKVRASGICGSDIPRVLHNGVHFYPIVLGHEFSGDVVEIGEGVTKVKVGDRVSGAPLKPCMKCDDCQNGNFSLCKHYSFIGSREQGSNADYVVIPEQNAVVYDSSISYEQAAMFEPSTVALHGLLQNEYQGGQYVAVLGGGTIGMFTMQWAKIFGSRKVVVFDISEERLELAKRLGADAVINTTKENYMQEAMALTGKKGYGYVFETAGQIPTMHMAFELAGNKANVCFIGTPHAELTFTPAMWENMNRKEFHLTGSWMSYSAPFPGKEWELTFVTATDGNHGRGVAWTASRLQQKAIVLMPKGTELARLEAIRDFEAEAYITDVNYDDTVRMARKIAAECGGIMVQDTSWEGYEDVPLHIMQGYTTMGYEIVQQLQGVRPTHVFLQAGVGAMAGAVAAFLADYYKADKPIITIVEPEKADCIFKTAKADDGRLHNVTGALDSIMAGLCCGEPCSLAWDMLRRYADNFASMPDEFAAYGMRVLGNPLSGDTAIVSGESGAAGLGFALLGRSDAHANSLLQLDESSVVLCISTEGDTAPAKYRSIVWSGEYSLDKLSSVEK